MEKIIFFPTNNIGKFERYKCAFEKAEIEYNRYFKNQKGENIKVEVQEDGKTTRENAEKKAKAYYEEYKKILTKKQFAIITTDEALYIEGLKENEQPGLFVRRFQGLNGSRATDDEVMLSDLSEEERNAYLSPYTEKVAGFVNENMLFNKE